MGTADQPVSPATMKGRFLAQDIHFQRPEHWTIEDADRDVAAVEAEAVAAAAEREQAARERLREALRELQSAQRDYRWLVHPRDEHGTCRLCGATEGQHHDSGHECGRLYDADHLADRALASPDAATPYPPEPITYGAAHATPAEPPSTLDPERLARAMWPIDTMGRFARAKRIDEARQIIAAYVATPPASSETPGEAQG